MTNIEDPFEFELFKNAMDSLADEMALTVFRTAYSGVLKGAWTIPPRSVTPKGKWWPRV